MIILIMGLPGNGKTTLANELKDLLPNCVWYNADMVRKQANDWDFSHEGRLRQAKRMKKLADESSEYDYCLIDFICPLPVMRDIISADILIWMDTYKISTFRDTNAIFEPPAVYDYRITSWNDPVWNKALQLISC